MKTVDFYWDAGSTNTYFAVMHLPGVARRTGAEIRCHPFNLGYVFRTNNYVLAEEPREKLRYRARDLGRWAEFHKLPFQMPSQFPIKTTKPLRGSLVMRELGLEWPYIESIFRAYWERNIVIDDYRALAPLVAELGVDPIEFAARAEADDIKAKLIDVTAVALARGIFGAPTMMVGDEMFWGKDRMDFLERALESDSD